MNDDDPMRLTVWLARAATAGLAVLAFAALMAAWFKDSDGWNWVAAWLAVCAYAAYGMSRLAVARGEEFRRPADKSIRV